MAKRIYRFLDNQRMKMKDLFERLYQIEQQTVEQENPEYVVAAVDPVNFEKPYAKTVEGVSTVHKATPSDMNGQAHFEHGSRFDQEQGLMLKTCGFVRLITCNAFIHLYGRETPITIMKSAKNKNTDSSRTSLTI